MVRVRVVRLLVLANKHKEHWVQALVGVGVTNDRV